MVRWFANWVRFRRSSAPNAQFAHESPRLAKKEHTAISVTQPLDLPSPNDGAAPSPPSPPGNSDMPLSPGQWWREGLQHENRAGDDFQANQLERMKSLRSSFNPASLAHVQASVWVEETRQVSLVEFLAETPRRYGASTKPFPNVGIAPTLPATKTVTLSDDLYSQTGSNVGALIFDPEVADAAIREKEAEVVFTSLAKLLQSTFGLDLLGEFMTEQMCAENLIFHEATNEVEQNDFPLPVVRNLIIHFIARGADAMVNISGSLSRDIQAELKRIESSDPSNPVVTERMKTLLRQARNEVFLLMQTDTMPRFIESEMSKGWKEVCRQAVLRADGIETVPPQDVRPAQRKRFASMLRIGSGLRQWGVAS